MSDTSTSGRHRISSSSPSAADPATLTSGAARDQQRADDLVAVRLVVHHEHSKTGENGILRLRRKRGRSRVTPGRRAWKHSGKPHGEGGSFPVAFALRLYRASVQLDDVTHDGETQAETAVCTCRPGVGLPERLEQMGKEIGFNSSSGVPTLISAPSSRRFSVTRISPPLGVNLIALDTRFQTTCWSRSESAEIDTGSSSRRTSSRMPLASAVGRPISTAAAVTASRLTVPILQAQFPKDDP